MKMHRLPDPSRCRCRPPSGGVLRWSFQVRDDAALVGRTAYLQVFLIDPGANPLGVIATEAGAAVIGAK